jgi:phosphoglycolate phosphatase-like HAD superfamily hydrolase
VQAGKGAGLFVAGVNTGILTEADLLAAGADVTFPTMQALHQYLKQQ